MAELRLVDANALPNYKCQVTATIGAQKGPAEMRFVFWQDIEKAPTIDAVPVVHGRWEYDRPNHYKCSVCESMWSGVVQFMKFCPHCGAKMEGVEE